MKQYWEIYVTNIWKNYANFSDRISRYNYWTCFFTNIIFALLLSLISFGVLGGLYGLAALIPGLALTIRRLRDIGKPWTWIFISFIPVAGPIWLIVLLAKESIPADGTPTT